MLHGVYQVESPIDGSDDLANRTISATLGPGPLLLEKTNHGQSARSVKCESQHEFRVVDGRATSRMHVIAELDLGTDMAREP
jgi:hypothetical protein